MPKNSEKFSPEVVDAVKKYNLIDDVLFTKAAEDKEFCQEVLRTICGDSGLVVVENRTQHRMHNLRGRSVVFDALCKLKNGTLVNIEVQKANIDDYQKRARYHGAVLSANITKKSTKFKDVPSIVIVFITNFDLFRKGFALYHIDRVLRETGEIVENGLSEIYVNATVKDGSNVSELMRIFVNLKAYNDKLFPVVSGVKKYYKETEEGENIMCAITEEVFAKGEAKGILRSIKNLVESLGVTVSRAMDILKIPAEERPFLFRKTKRNRLGIK